jgi:hypothetical protein
MLFLGDRVSVVVCRARRRSQRNNEEQGRRRA